MKRPIWWSAVGLAGAVAVFGAAGARARMRTPVAVVPSVARPTTAPPSEPAPGKDAPFTGVVLATESVDVAARADGRVAEVYVRLGDTVRRGEKLAALEVRALDRERAMARASVDGAHADVEKARVDLAEADERLGRRRAAAALPIPAVSGEDLSSAEFRSRQLGLTVTAAEARLAERKAELARLDQQRDDAVLRAPFDGAVAARYADPGASVTRGAPIVRLIGRDARVRFAAPEDRAAALHAGDEVTVTVDEARLRAVVEKIAPELDAAARMVFVEARLASPGGSALAGRLAHVSLGGP
jgi:RND family efflux transporter MFP subunit